MIKQESKPVAPSLEIDLNGPEGNAFNLLGIASKLAYVLGLNKDEILEEMKSSDYKNLVLTMDKYFGDFIIFYNFK
jgi:hypothetical protein